MQCSEGLRVYILNRHYMWLIKSKRLLVNCVWQTKALIRNQHSNSLQTYDLYTRNEFEVLAYSNPQLITYSPYMYTKEYIVCIVLKCFEFTF